METSAATDSTTSSTGETASEPSGASNPSPNGDGVEDNVVDTNGGATTPLGSGSQDDSGNDSLVTILIAVIAGEIFFLTFFVV